ncbi:MAG: hypothetical protein ACRBG0_11345 [Lewinella sp.]|uniref:hypothetical protein n=1 Tax=Lewinella sp. TaxID=2004506 RepID=UPI003D6B28E7
MNRILCFSLLVCLATSCQKSILQEAQNVEEVQLANYYLDLDISNIDYMSAEDQDVTHVDADQDLDFEFTFKEVASLDRYLYFASNQNIPADSLAIIGNIRFIQSPGSAFPEDLFDLEFVLTEALGNLEQNADGTYGYIDKQLLANRLATENFGNNSLFAGYNVNQMMLTLPLPQEPLSGWGDMVVSSNGFYFPHEVLDFTEVSYLAEEDAIVVGGTFEVELKVMSCGFYSFYSVQEASFRALIQ